MIMKYKKLIVIVALLGLVLFGALEFVNNRIDAQSYRTQIEKMVLERLGQPLTIRGGVSVSLLPVPTVHLSGVALHDPDEDSETPTPSLTANMVHIRSSVWSLFSGELQVTGITLEKPMLEVYRSPENVVRWGWLGGGLFFGNAENTFDIEIAAGNIIYHNKKTDKDIAINDINAAIVTGDLPQAAGSLSVQGHTLQFKARTQGAQGGSAALPLAITLSSDMKDNLSLEGTVDLSTETPQVNGKITLESENILHWFQPKIEKIEGIFAKITDDASSSQGLQPTAMPVTLSGRWAQTGSLIKITLDEFKGLNSAGAGVIDAQWIEGLPRIEATVNFSAINYDYWKIFILAALSDQEISKAVGYRSNMKENPLPDDVNFSLHFNAQQVYFGNQIWKDARFSATLDHAAVTIHQLDVNLPGDSSLSLFGIVSQSSTREMRFEGTLDTQGKSLRELLTVFDSSALDLPKEELSEFHVRSNIYIAADQIRLSEADAKISQLNLNGGLVAYYDTMPRFEAEVKLSDIDLDYFRDTWRKKQKTGKKETFFLQYDSNQNFSWLQRLRASIDFKVTIDKFRFMERDGNSAAFRIFVRENELGIYNIRLNYPEDTLEAGFSLNVNADKPFFNVLLNTAALDTAYFLREDDAEDEKREKENARTKRWSEELINMDWMEGWKGAFDISIGKLIHRDWIVNDIKFRGGLENNSLGIQSLGFTYWQGRAQVSGSLYGGKVPGLSLGFTLSNTELQEILQSLVKRDNISGKISVNGTMSTSGVNVLSWISQAESEMVFSGRGVTVDRFNLQGVVDAVSVSRTAADVLNNVNLALIKGKTEMSVDGNVNVKNGFLRTPGIALKAGNISGNLSGEVKLIPWKMDLTSVYQFPSLATEKVPTMVIQLIGPIEGPTMGVDTASLEAYVAKRLIGSGNTKKQ